MSSSVKKIKAKKRIDKIKPRALFESWREISLILAAETSLKEIIKKSLRVACQAISGKYAAIMFESKGHLRIAADYGFPVDYTEYIAKEQREGRITIALEESPSGIAFQEGKQVITKNVYTDPRWTKLCYVGKRYGYGSLVYTPLKIKKEPIGLILVYKEKTYKTEEEAFPKAEQEFLVTIARPIAVAIENIRLYEKLKEMNETLAQRVSERTKELEREKEELEKTREATLNILQDVEEAKVMAEIERNKTLTIINNFTDGLLVTDNENKISLINPRVEKIFNIKNSDIVGKIIAELGVFSSLNPLINLLAREDRKDKEIFREEIKINGEETSEVSVVPMISGKEQVGALIILHDITREKMIERMKTEFVSLAAHQLRTPLSAIKWTLRMLLDGDLGAVTKEQREFIEKTYNSNERMINLINDLLDVTRIEEGRYLYKPVMTAIEPVAQFVINSYKDEAEKRKLIFELKKPEKELPKTVMDVEKIRLALQNLLDNAVRYTSAGGKITVSLEYLKNEIEISVSDTGVGIPNDQQKRIFTKFFRASNVLRMDTEGSGLGLFIAKNIIEAHGGRIWFKSEEGRGTTFSFTIPVREEFKEFLKEF